MNPDEFVSISRGLVKRGYADIEPKVAAGAGGGVIFGIVITILASYHVLITPAVQQWGPYLVAVLCGYLFPSSGQVIVTKADDQSKTTTTTTVGAVQTIVTGPIPIQDPAPAPAPAKRAPDVPLSALLHPTGPAAVPPFPSLPNEQPTQVMYKP